MIIWRIQSLANNHPEDPASYKWSSGGTGLLQMIMLNPCHPNQLSQDLDSILRTYLEQFALVDNPLVDPCHPAPSWLSERSLKQFTRQDSFFLQGAFIPQSFLFKTMKLVTNPDPNFLLEVRTRSRENAIEIIASVACSEHIFTRGGIASITLTGSLDKSFLHWGRNQIHFNMN